MAVDKLEEKMRKVTFLSDEKVDKALDDLYETLAEGQDETIQVQVVTKGYKNRVDQKTTKLLEFPHEMRKKASFCVIGDEKTREVVKEHGIPFALISEYEGKSQEMVKKRKGFISRSSYVVLCGQYNKAFSLKEILMKRKTHFICKTNEELLRLIDEIQQMYKMKIRDWNSVSFPTGHTGMVREQLKVNLRHGMDLLVENLKKGMQNVKKCFIKRSTGPSIRIY